MTTPYVYLAGPMTGWPLWNFPAFAAARKALRARGLAVYCPAEADLDAGFDPATGAGLLTCSQYMARDLPKVRGAAAVVVLPGWQYSTGARREVAEAERAGVPVLALQSMHAANDRHASRGGFSAVSHAGKANSEAAGAPAVGVLADTSHDGLWRRAVWPGEVIL